MVIFVFFILLSRILFLFSSLFFRFFFFSFFFLLLSLFFRKFRTQEKRERERESEEEEEEKGPHFRLYFFCSPLCLSVPLFFHSHAQMLNILFFLPCFRLSSLLVVCVLLRSSVLCSSSRRKPREGAKMRNYTSEIRKKEEETDG